MTPVRAPRARAAVRALVVLGAAVVLGSAWGHPSSGPPAPSPPGTVVLGPSALADGLLGLSKPPAPATVSAVPHDRSALVSWSGVTTVSSGRIVGYRVYVDGVQRAPDHPASQRSATVSLSNYQSYRITVRAVDDGGNPESPDSSPVDVTPFDDVAPSPVTGLTATRGDGRITLTWEPEGGVEADRAGVRVYVDGALRVSLPAATTTYDVTGLTNDRKHSFYLVAYDTRPGGYGPPGSTAPNESARSATVQATPTDLTPPSAPTAFAAVRGDGRTTVTWTAPPEDDVDHYEVVDENGARVASFNAPATSGTAGGLTNGRAYRLRLVAVDTHGNHSPASAEVTVTPAKPPVARTGLSAAPGDRQVSLSWDPQDTDARRAVATSVDVLVDRVVRTTVTGTATAVTITGLTNGTRYDFSLVAVDAEGRTSPESVRVQATPTDLTAPPAPTGLTAARGGSGEIVLSWTAVAAADLARYEVVDAGGAVVATVTAGTTTATIGSLTDGTAYTYRLRAVDVAGNASAPSDRATLTPLALPAAITGPVARPAGADVRLDWQQPSTPPTGTAVTTEVRVHRVGDPTPLATVDASVTTFTVVGAASASPAPSFYLVGVDADHRASATWQTVSAVLQAPVATASAGQTSATIAWSRVPGAQGYRVERLVGSTWQAEGTTTDTTLTVSPLVQDAAYTFRVVALASTPEGGSGPSNAVTVTVGYAGPTTAYATGSGGAAGVAASRDGRYTVVAVPGTNGLDLVRTDRQSPAREPVVAGIRAGAPGYARAAVSENGRYVALITREPLDPRDQNGAADVYRYDVTGRTWTLVSAPGDASPQTDTTAAVPAGLTEGALDLPGEGPQLAITADGSKVFFASTRDGLVPGDTDGSLDVFSKDVGTEALTRITTASDWRPVGTGFAVTPDGGYVLYAAGSDTAWNLVRQVATPGGARVLVKRSPDETFNPLAGVGQIAMSDDGRRVVTMALISSRVTLLRADLTSSTPPPRGAPEGTLPSASTTTVIATSYGDGQVAISPSGTYAFLATEDKLLPADTNGHVDVYRVRLTSPSSDRVLVTAGPDGGPASIPGQGTATGFDELGSVTAQDDTHVVVVTQRPLVAADTNGERDAYAVDLGAPVGSRARLLVGAS